MKKRAYIWKVMNERKAKKMKKKPAWLVGKRRRKCMKWVNENKTHEYQIWKVFKKGNKDIKCQKEHKWWKKAIRKKMMVGWMASASENFLKQAFKISQIPGPKKNVTSKKFTSQKFTIKSSQTRSLQAVFEFLLSIFTSFDVTLVIRISHFFKQARSSKWSMWSCQEMFLKCLGHKARSLPVISFQMFNNDSKKLFYSEQEVC